MSFNERGKIVMNCKIFRNNRAIIALGFILLMAWVAGEAAAQTTRVKKVVLGFEPMEGDYGLIVKTTDGNFIYYQDKSSKRMDDLLNESLTKKMPIIIISGPKYIKDVQQGR